MAQLTRKPYDRRKTTFIAQEWEPTSEDLFIRKPYEYTQPDSTLLEKLPEWLANWKCNHETIGFDRTIEDLPKIEGPALIVDNSMTGSLDKHIEALKKFDGIILACDRAASKLCAHGVVPDILCNVDSSFLCIGFVDNPAVRKYMDSIHGVFAATAHPLTIRAFSGRRYYFQPWVGYPLTDTLAAKGRLPVMSTGGSVHNTLWILAVNRGAKKIGLVGIDNSYRKYGESEYPGIKHKIVENRYGKFYVGPVYELYNDILLKYAKFARDEHGVHTVNCNRGGILYGDGVEDLSLREFVEKYGQGRGHRDR